MSALALNNDARSDPSGNILGDPTEAALFTLARKNGFEKMGLYIFITTNQNPIFF